MRNVVSAIVKNVLFLLNKNDKTIRFFDGGGANKNSHEHLFGQWPQRGDVLSRLGPPGQGLQASRLPGLQASRLGKGLPGRPSRPGHLILRASRTPGLGLQAQGFQPRASKPLSLPSL